MSFALSTLRMKPPAKTCLAPQVNLVIKVTVKCSGGATLAPLTLILKAPPGAFGMSTTTSLPPGPGLPVLLSWTTPAGSVMLSVIALPG